MDGLPNFITHGAPLARFERRSSAKNWLHIKIDLSYNFLDLQRSPEQYPLAMRLCMYLSDSLLQPFHVLAPTLSAE